ncbi:MAG: MFS transporter [Cyclobacteriaceae bacterium]|nr:MFS transporter [Cyclobacteriaceae bacterium]
MKRVLPVIVVSQFLCTSLWFAGNSVIGDLANTFELTPDFLAHLTSAVQFGFISGTFVFAVFTIADRFSPSLIFFISAIMASLFNLAICLNGIHVTELLVFRFLTGFFLAGIYPVCMKIASDYYQEGLGMSLGFLVGALVLGTAFPHLVKTITTQLPWRYVVYTTSILSAVGGLGMWLLVPDGPKRKTGQQINFSAFVTGFKKPDFRAAAFGYFGHMWELYTFWAFVPVILFTFKNQNPHVELNIPLMSFLIIGVGSLACVFSGYASQYFGVKRTATISLLLSCLCCLASPFFLTTGSALFLVGFLFFWGLVVIADSPLFSTLVAKSAPEESKGTSLTIVNCIGFSITIISIQFINLLTPYLQPQFIYMVLAIGPVLGLLALTRDKRTAKFS